MADQENFRLCQEVNIRVVMRELVFKKPAKTSRNTLKTRKVWYIILHDPINEIFGIGESAPIEGLSNYHSNHLEIALQGLSQKKLTLELFENACNLFSSFRMGVETACNDLRNGGCRLIFDHDQQTICINGLVWMNGYDEMLEEARTKIRAGFTTIKFKVGAIDFQQEINLIHYIRSEFPDITIRLDANGAFEVHDALRKLEVLARYRIHSIEQPIRAGFWPFMADIALRSPIPIALDEDLIGVNSSEERTKLLETVKPHFLVLKPTLHGGFAGADNWVERANAMNIGWWATSALESNIGLNAIAQWVTTKGNNMAQGLGTGSLFENNIPSPLEVDQGYFKWNEHKNWNVDELLIDK
jgi:O-succinylbenzoate synthase